MSTQGNNETQIKCLEITAPLILRTESMHMWEDNYHNILYKYTIHNVSIYYIQYTM